jgi:hypothetical protein
VMTSFGPAGRRQQTRTASVLPFLWDTTFRIMTRVADTFKEHDMRYVDELG